LFLDSFRFSSHGTKRNTTQHNTPTATFLPWPEGPGGGGGVVMMMIKDV
jgi:hypothetical protein